MQLFFHKLGRADKMLNLCGEPESELNEGLRSKSNAA